MLKKKKKTDLIIQPEIFSQSYWLAKFLNKFMERGRKDSVKKIIFSVFKKIKIKYHKNALKIVFFALVKYRPLLGFFSIRLGREKKKIPFPLTSRRQLILSLKWFVYSIKLLRYQNYNIPIEKLLYHQLKTVLYKRKNNVNAHRRAHVKELIESRMNLHLRKILKQ